MKNEDGQKAKNSKKQSAGILLYRIRKKILEVLLAHPGGPYWKNKDAGSWTIPKGEFSDQEYPLDAAKREFREELGFTPEGKFVKLSPVRQKGGKMVYAWACEGDMDIRKIESNLFEIEWPPNSGKKQKFPEVDKAAWFNVKEAMGKINESQLPLIDELITLVN